MDTKGYKELSFWWTSLSRKKYRWSKSEGDIWAHLCCSLQAATTTSYPACCSSFPSPHSCSGNCPRVFGSPKESINVSTGFKDPCGTKGHDLVVRLHKLSGWQLDLMFLKVFFQLEWFHDSIAEFLDILLPALSCSFYREKYSGLYTKQMSSIGEIHSQ